MDIIIEPTNFDLIVIGMGLTESIITAAAAGAGKTVLQINPDRLCDSPFASLSPKDLTSFLHLHSYASVVNTDISDEPINSGSSFNFLPLKTRPLYSSIAVNVFSPEVLNDSLKKEFYIDLAGPKILFCAEPMIDLIRDSEVHKYMEFLSVDAGFFVSYDDDDGGGGSGRERWTNVPDSRKAIFKDKSLSFKEKNQLMRFFKLAIQAHDSLSNFSSTVNSNIEQEEEGNDTPKISQEDLETPFVELLTKKFGLSHKLISMILYAIAMADHEQDNVEVYKGILKTKDGIDRLILHHKSIDRFPDATGAMMYPIHGQGELAESFSRHAAVMGGFSVNQMPVVGLLVDKDGGNYKGVKLATGQELFSHQLILNPSIIIPSGLSIPAPSFCPQDGYYDFGIRVAKEKVVRGICITESSLKPDVANFMVFYPPRSLGPFQLSAVRAFQLNNKFKACPSGMFVVYLSTICEDDDQGKKSVNAAIDTLFSTPVSGNSEENSWDPPSDNTVVKVKPNLLWSTVYIQELLDMGEFDRVSSTPMPDGNLQYNNVVDAAIKVFKKMYPDEEFFPKRI
ncbi:hypothetical protein ACH5RR_013478 [Cinchona calisaya]|uniref:Rab escort protein n=1 Tax=Cinchona calisaya TaxID=153742 RepID=A0ABD3A062_9GENT